MLSRKMIFFLPLPLPACPFFLASILHSYQIQDGGLIKKCALARQDTPALRAIDHTSWEMFMIRELKDNNEKEEEKRLVLLLSMKIKWSYIKREVRYRKPQIVNSRMSGKSVSTASMGLYITLSI